MKIKCFSLDDFLMNIRNSEVFEGRIFVEKYEEPINGTNRQNASSFEVSMQLSVVIKHEDYFLVECVEYCGINRSSDGGSTEGDDVFNQKKQQLQAFCDDLGIRLMPGVLSF